MKNLIAFIALLISIGCMYFGIYVMFYGGIIQVLENWNINNSAVAWGIIKVFYHIPFVVEGWYIFLAVLRHAEKWMETEEKKIRAECKREYS